MEPNASVVVVTIKLFWAKIIGALVGAGASLLVMKPKGKRDAAARGVVSIAGGLLFGSYVAAKLGLSAETFEEVAAASCAAAFATWFVASAFVRWTSSGNYPFKK